MLARRLLAAFSIALLGCTAGEELAGRAPLRGLPPRPGAPVIVISFDALRRDTLGVYGYAKPTSPHLDRFAEDAVVFDAAYTASPSTLYSFKAAFTGRLPSAKVALAETETLATRFSGAGYETAAFLNNPWLKEAGLSRGFQDYVVFSREPDEDVLAAGLDWIEKHRNDAFFVWIHLLDPHSPYSQKAIATELYDPDYRGVFEQQALLYGLPFQIEDPGELARVRQLYDGEVRHVDALFGRLIDRLAGLSLLESALIIVTADHGEEFMEHGRLQHSQLYEEQLRIPLIVRHPDLERGFRSDVPVSNLDLLPTLAALAGIPGEHRGPGGDLSNEIPAERSIPAVKTVRFAGRREVGASLRRGRWRLIVECLDERRELYDLERDPLQRDDLAKAQEETVRSMEAELWAAVERTDCQDLVGWSPLRGRHALDREREEALKALGYLQD